MKTLQTLLLISVLLLSSPMAVAQDLLDALKQTAEMHNEANPQGEDGAGEDTDSSNEWQEYWEKLNMMEVFDTKHLQCTALMVQYVYAYLKLYHEHKLGELGMSACDAYGMMSLALASSTMIMYCPEEMDKLSDEQLLPTAEAILSNLQGWFNVHETEARAGVSIDNKVWQNFLEKMVYIFDKMGLGDDYPVGEEFGVFFIRYLIEFFKPGFIIPQTLKIAQEMEALGCSKPN